MTTLAAAVAIGDSQIVIDAPLQQGQIPGWVKIDSELLKVGGQHFRTGTTLVLSEPATAAHDNGATVTYAGKPFDAAFLAATSGSGGGAITVTDGVTSVADATSIAVTGGTVTDEGAGVVGVAVQTRKIGPFRVRFDDTGINGTSPPSSWPMLAELAPGTLLIHSWASFLQGWWDSDTAELRIMLVGVLGAGSSGKTLMSYNALNDPAGYDPTDNIIVEDWSTGATYKSLVGYCNPVADVVHSLRARVVRTGATNLQGIADVYALIAEPAA